MTVESFVKQSEGDKYPTSSLVLSIMNGEDMEDRWVTNLNDDRMRFYLVSSLLDPQSDCDT